MSSLDRLDHLREMITRNMFGKIRDPKHPLYYPLLLVKPSHGQMVL